MHEAVKHLSVEKLVPRTLNIKKLINHIILKGRNHVVIYVDIWSQASKMFRLVKECDRGVQLWQTKPNMTLVLISNPAEEAGIQRDPITSFIGPQRVPSRTEGLLGALTVT